MSYIENLRESKNDVTVAFHEFALSTRIHQNALFCFFEGKNDNAYYIPRIKHYANEYVPITCGNKQAVLKIYELVTNKTEYLHYKKGFFIDRDFDAPIEEKEPPVYETPCYSIENLYVSPTVFREVLINDFHLSEATDKEMFKDLLNRYSDRQNEFHASILLFNAWYACLIDRRNKEGIEIKAKLKEKWEQGFITITLECVEQHYTLASIRQLYPNAVGVDEKELNSKIAHFESLPEKYRVFRGKYEMEFLLQFVKAVLRDSYTERKMVKEKIKHPFGDGSTLSQEQLLQLFQSYAETPQGLKDYIRLVVNN